MMIVRLDERGYNMNRKIAHLGLYTAAAMIFSYVESLFPVFTGVPGVKLGLPNLIIVLVLFQYSWKEAALVSAARIIAAGFLFGNLFSIVYSLAGAVLSMVSMNLLKKIQGFSMVGISMAGGVTHNIGQLLIAMWIVENFSLVYYLPMLLISGVLTGFCIGILAKEIRKRIKIE